MTSTFINHCETVYNALDERAVIKENEKVFSGAVAQVYSMLGISQSYYGPIFQTLEDVGAVLKLQRGGRGVDTVFVLRGLPEVWPEGLGWNGRNNKPLTSSTKYDTLLLDVRRIQEQIGTLDLVGLLVNLEQRLSRIEANALKAIEGDTPHGKK